MEICLWLIWANTVKLIQPILPRLSGVEDLTADLRVRFRAVWEGARCCHQEAGHGGWGGGHCEDISHALWPGQVSPHGETAERNSVTFVNQSPGSCSYGSGLRISGLISVLLVFKLWCFSLQDHRAEWQPASSHLQAFPDPHQPPGPSWDARGDAVGHTNGLLRDPRLWGPWGKIWGPLPGGAW